MLSQLRHPCIAEGIIVIESFSHSGVVSTKNCRSCCWHDSILHDGMHAETLKIHLPKASEVSSSLALTASRWSFFQFLLCYVRLRFLFLEHFQPAISTVFCSLFCFRLNSSMRYTNGTHVFWENGIHYPRVSPGAHPLTKNPEDSGYEIALRSAVYLKLTADQALVFDWIAGSSQVNLQE